MMLHDFKEKTIRHKEDTMKENGLIIGLDIGGTNVRIGMVNKSKVVEEFEIIKSKEIFHDKPIENLSCFIEDYRRRKGKNKNILAVSLGFPSTIDRTRKIVLSTPNLTGMNNLNVVEELQESLELPIFLERDVNLLIQYDMYMNKIHPESTVLGFYIGTGLGNAIVIKGRIYNGKNGCAGELGHIPIMNNTIPCGCGNKGCMELFSSGKYLQIIREEFFPETSLDKIFVKHSQDPKIVEYVEYLSIPIATEISILDPDYVILGGGVLQMEGFPFHKLESNILSHTRKPFPADNLAFHYARAHQENGVIGAGIYGFSCLKEGRR